jgi:hypothetical protein
MFNISESNIIDQSGPGELSGNKDLYQVRISRNQTEPRTFIEGVDGLDISRVSDDRFHVEYWGYMYGDLVITRDGVDELKQTFLDDQEEIPGWTLSTELSEIPEWFPAPGDAPSPVTCVDCGSDVSVTEVVTPWSGESQDRYCPDCWSTVQEEI